MRSKAFIAAILVIVGSWLALQLTRNHFQYRIMRNRDQQISVTLQEIGKIKNTLTLTAQDSVSAKDLLSAIEISRLEGQIRDLRMENAIDRSKSNENTMPEVIPLILLVWIALQIGMPDKRPNPDSKHSA
jgi:hypothetical protein